MKRQLNVVLGLVIAGLITTAYATTCYLNGIALAFVPGDQVNAAYCFNTYTGGGCTASTGCCSWTASVYADENAYWPDLIAVTKGGKTETSPYTFAAYPGGDTDRGWNQTGLKTDPFLKFKVYYYDPNVGSTVTGWNGDPNVYGSTVTAFTHPTARFLDDSATSCN